MACALLTALIPPQNIRADSAAHVHDENCYTGTIHAAHTSACYTTENVTRYCSGTYRYDGYVDVTINEYFTYYYCGNRNCGWYYDGDPVGNAVKECRYYVSSYGTWYPSDYVSSYYCDWCGRSCRSKSQREDRYTSSIERLRCSSCGAIAYDPPYSNCSPRYEFRTHGSYSTTQQRLICTKQLGAYYDGEGNPAGCVCDRIVKAIAPEEPEQVVRLGERPNTKVALALYNGQLIPDYECSYEGFDPYDLSGAWQNVTLTVRNEDYPYRYNETTKKREAGTKSTTIRVKVLGYYDLSLVSDEGGRIACGKKADGSWDFSKQNLSVLVGSRVTVGVVPSAGYTVKLFKVSSDTGQKNLAADIGNEGEYINPDEEVTVKGNTVEYSFLMPANNVTLSAKFTPARYTVTFDANGGNWGGRISPVVRSATFGKSYLSTKTFPWDPVREGQVFIGWFDGKGNRTEKTDVCTEVGDHTLYAGWRDAGEVAREIEFEDRLIPDMPETVNGFHFDEKTFWRWEEKNGNGIGSALPEDYHVNGTEDLTLYGHWDPNEYVITFDPNRGVLLEEEKKKNVIYHRLIGDLPAPEKEGAGFMGWFTDPKEGEEVSETDVMTVPSDILLFAHWDKENETGLRIECGVYAVNNDMRMTRNEDGIAVCKAGDRVSFFLKIRSGKDREGTFDVNVKPKYYLTENGEEIHVLSTGWQGDRIVMFSERGRDFDDSLELRSVENETPIEFHWVLPHLSYVVKEENYEEMLSYSELNTLSGKEPFFEKDVSLTVVFSVIVRDREGREIENGDTVSLIVNIR